MFSYGSEYKLAMIQMKFLNLGPNPVQRMKHSMNSVAGDHPAGDMPSGY